MFAKTDRVLTATEEFNLEPSMRAAIYSAFYLGWLFGDPFFGWIADAWGERYNRESACDWWTVCLSVRLRLSQSRMTHTNKEEK